MCVKEGMDMRKVMLLAVLFVALWCNSALAYTPVQMNDTYSLHEIIQRYNDYCRRVDSDITEFMIPGVFTKMDETYMPYTLAYSTENSLTGIATIFCINENGKVASFAVNVPKTHSASDCVTVASRIIRAMDDGHAWREVMESCARAIATEEMQIMWTPAAKRYYAFNGRTTQDSYQIIAFAAQD
jgi:hypothetical protein